ncbi:MAG TPA: MIP/aquaporin family protein [Anaerolineae bacterium]|nr:MIP/aquaporin family protein [Anaerolineae bacterium]
MSPFVGELLGTMMLILLGNGVVAAVLLGKSKAQGSGWIVITAGWCFAVMVGVFTAQAAGSGQADLNPAVTIGKIIRGAGGGAATTLSEGLARIAGEFVGAFLGSVLVFLAYYKHWGETADANLKLACHSTIPAIRSPLWNLITEIIGTFVLMFVIYAIFSASATAQGAPSTGVGPFLVAALVWGIGLSLGGPTGYAINPARDLGPRIAHFLLPIPGKGGSDWGYSWIPVVGPVIGGALAAFLAQALGM